MTKSTNPLKIGFVLDDGLDNPDGVQQNILTLGKWLVDAGHEVKYLVGETHRNDLPGVIVLSRNLRVSFNGNRLSIPLFSSATKIKALIKNEKFDIVHVQVPYSPFMAARLLKRVGSATAIVGTFHILPTSAVSLWGTKLLGMLLFWNLKKFNRHLAVSEPASIFAKQSFGINCDILPNPVDIKKYKNNQKIDNGSDSVRIVFLGRLVPRKGCGYLLKAIKTMLDNYPPATKFQINICGDGPQSKQLMQYAADNNLLGYMSFHGFVSEQDKIKMLRQADIAVFPSLNGESFGIVLVEAMAANGGIVIGGDNPGYRSVLGSLPESLIDPRLTDDFSKMLAQFIDSPDSRRYLLQKQQALVGQFDIDIIGPKLLKIYSDCIYAKKSG